MEFALKNLVVSAGETNIAAAEKKIRKFTPIDLQNFLRTNDPCQNKELCGLSEKCGNCLPNKLYCSACAVFISRENLK